MTNLRKTLDVAASKGLRILFAPQLGKSTGSLSLILMSFVQLMAQFLASAKLIPATHRALRPLRKEDARLGEVLALAYANVRSPGTRIDQMAVFVAVTGLMTLASMMVFYTLTTMLIGAAHASMTFTITIGGCTLAASTSFFTAPCATDIAQNWIDTLLLGATTNDLTKQIASVPLQRGLAAMFQTYSFAMLILAGFLVMYHLLGIVAGTAHEGKFGGRAMNQVWAPIRLIMAIAMLVPIGNAANGFNSGQYVAVQAAKWGSALASNTWLAFANTFTSGIGNMGVYMIIPPMPKVTPLARGALSILACREVYERLAADAEAYWEVTPSEWYFVTGGTKEQSWDYHNNSTKDVEYNVCGTITRPDPDFTTTASADEYLSSSNWYNQSVTIRKAILAAHEKAVNEMMAKGSPLRVLAAKVYDSIDTNYVLTGADVMNLNTAIGNYRKTLANQVVNALLSQSGMNLVNEASTRGWASAGTAFNSIARLNGLLLDTMQEVPTAAPVAYYKPIGAEEFSNKTSMMEARLDSAVGSMIKLASTNSGYDPIFEGDDQSAGGSPLQSYLNDIAKGFSSLLGQDATSTSNGTEYEIKDASLASISTFAKPLKLNTANPLAELAAIGQRLINIAIKSADKESVCGAMLQQQMVAIRGGEKADIQKITEEAKAKGCSVQNGVAGVNSMIVQTTTGTMIAAGVTLAFVLPMIPFIRFMFGILTWILSIFETVIAIPVVALAHIKMDGEGLAGPSARTAYLLLLQVFLRPVLMVFGLIMSLLLFNVMVVALNEFYTSAVRSAEAGGKISALSTVVYTLIYGALAYGMANAAFKAIDLIPSQCLQWMGGPTQQSIDGMQYVQSATGQASSVYSSSLTAGASQGLLKQPEVKDPRDSIRGQRGY